MRTAVLLSADRGLTAALECALLPRVHLQSVPVEHDEPLPSVQDVADVALVIFVDTDHRNDVPTWVRNCIEGHAPIVAIISSLAERHDLYLSGVHGCLLRPLVSEEIRAVLPQQPGTESSNIPTPSQLLQGLEQQISQNERWITIGRLVAAICHDVTNRMQAAQGALSLACEEPGLSADLQTYLEICQQETRRVSTEMQRLRSIYHPAGDQPGPVDVAATLLEVQALAVDGSRQVGVSIETAAAPGLPCVHGRIGQLQFVVLGLLLNMVDLLARRGGGQIWMQAKAIGPTIQIEISGDAKEPALMAAPNAEQAGWPRTLADAMLGVTTMRQVLLSQNGEVGVSWSDSGLTAWLTLPLV